MRKTIRGIFVYGAMTATYKVTYRTPAGIKLIDSLPFSHLDLWRKENEIGKLVLRLPPVYPVGFFARDGILEVRRSINGGPYYLEGETAWLIHLPRYATDQTGRRIIEVEAADALDILRRRIVAYDAGTDYTEKLDVADDLIKDLARENFGVAAIDAARNISAYLSVAADLSQGAIVGGEISYQNVYDVAKTFADASAQAGVRVIFDLVRTGPVAFELRTYKDYRGVDHSAASEQPVTVAEERGNLTTPETYADYIEEWNYVYAGGKGEDEWRVMAESTDSARASASPFARTEYFYDAANETDPTRLAKIAASVLQAGRPRVRFTGQVLDTPQTTYGVHYRYGDLVTAVYQGNKFNCRVSSVRLVYDAENGEAPPEIRLEGENA
jgi:hypothetical protein